MCRQYARVVELADSLDSGSSVHYARAGSSPASRTKKKDTTFVVSFFLGAAPFGISMPCRSKPSLRNCLVLRTCEFTAHQRRRSEDRSDISIAQILTVPSTSEQVLYRCSDLFYKSGDACFAVFSFPLHPASSGSQWAGPACGRYSPAVSSRREVSASTDASLFAGSDVLIGPYPSTPLKKCP